MQSLTQKSLSAFEKSRKQIVSDGHSFVTDPELKKPIIFELITFPFRGYKLQGFRIAVNTGGWFDFLFSYVGVYRYLGQLESAWGNFTHLFSLNI